MSPPTHAGLQMSETVPGLFSLFRCAEPEPSELPRSLHTPEHGHSSCWLSLGQAVRMSKWAGCFGDAYADRQSWEAI